MLNLKYLSLVTITCLNALRVHILQLYGSVKFLLKLLTLFLQLLV